MTLARFEQITSTLTFTDIPVPLYTGKFHEVRQMNFEFNHHMKEVSVPSWVSCLDEIVSIWTSRWTCPGWMYVPRKTHPQGNEYHSIACGESGIMYRQILRSTSHHEIIWAPTFCKFSGNKWAKRYKMKYQQHACNTIKCKNRV